MPKNRNVVKRDGVTHKYNVASKLRIGTRKSGKAGHLMSNAALRAVLDSNSKAKYHANARAVLASRGVDTTANTVFSVEVGGMTAAQARQILADAMK